MRYRCGLDHDPRMPRRIAPARTGKSARSSAQARRCPVAHARSTSSAPSEPVQKHALGADQHSAIGMGDCRKQDDELEQAAPLLIEILDARGDDDVIACVHQTFIGKMLLTVEEMVKIASDELGQRSEERRVGKESVSTCRSRWSPT